MADFCSTWGSLPGFQKRQGNEGHDIPVLVSGKLRTLLGGDQSPPKNNLHSEWFVDTSRLPPSNVPRREMPSSELGGKSIEFGPTVNLEVSTWKHQNHRVYTLDIRITVAKVLPSHFFFCRIPQDVFKDVSLGLYTCEVLVKCLDCRNWRSKLEDEKGFAPKAKHRAHLEQTFDLQKIILTARGSKWEGPAIEYRLFSFFYWTFGIPATISQGEIFRETSRATWSSCRFKGYGVTLSCTRQEHYERLFRQKACGSIRITWAIEKKTQVV